MGLGERQAGRKLRDWMLLSLGAGMGEVAKGDLWRTVKHQREEVGK